MVKLFMQMSRFLCTGLLMTAASFAGAQSADIYPNKPVRIVIPFSPGGATSVIGGELSGRMGKALGQNFINDFRPGANSAIGIGIAAKAAPDGYTLLLATSSYVANHWLFANLPFDSLKDLTPIGMMARTESVLAVHPSAPSTLKEFISYAKANPGKLNFPYTGTIGLLGFHLFMKVTGTQFTLVSYKGGPESVNSMLTGETVGDITGVGNVLGFIKAGRMKPLAITGDKRSPVVPDVPTFSEVGLKDFNQYNWFALLAPSKTPKDILRKLNVELRRAQEAPEAISTLGKLNIAIFPTTVDDAENFIRAEAAKYGKLVKDAGLTPKAN